MLWLTSARPEASVVELPAGYTSTWPYTPAVVPLAELGSLSSHLLRGSRSIRGRSARKHADNRGEAWLCKWTDDHY
jgi:hypothetical protein